MWHIDNLVTGCYAGNSWEEQLMKEEWQRDMINEWYQNGYVMVFDVLKAMWFIRFLELIDANYDMVNEEDSSEFITR